MTGYRALTVLALACCAHAFVAPLRPTSVPARAVKRAAISMGPFDGLKDKLPLPGKPDRQELRAREIEANGGVEDDEMVDEHEMHRLRKASRPTYHQVVGKASGRAWKEPAKQRAATFMKAQVGGIKSWDDRMKEKAAKKAFQERIREAKEEAKAGRKAEHDRRAAKKAQKEENRKKNEAAQSIAVKQTVAKKTGAKSKERKLQKALKMT